MNFVNNFTRTWKIKNISQIFRASEGNFHGIVSEPFEVFKSEGRLKLCWMQMSPDYDQYKLIPSIEISANYPIRVMVRMSIECARFSFELQDEFPWTITGERIDVWSSQCLLDLSEFLINDSITLICDMVQLLSVQETETSPTTVNEDNAKFSPKNDYMGMFINGDKTDFTIFVGDKEIKCHRYILSTVSSLLNADNENLTESNSITLDGYEYSCILEFIGFLYSSDEKILSLDKYGEKFLELAEIYQVPLLKATSESCLVKKLSTDNARCYAWIGLKYNANYLRRKAEELIFQQYEKENNGFSAQTPNL